MSYTPNPGVSRLASDTVLDLPEQAARARPVQSCLRCLPSHLPCGGGGDGWRFVGAGGLWRWTLPNTAASFHSQRKWLNEIMVTGWEDVAMATQQPASLGMLHHSIHTTDEVVGILLASAGLAYFPSCSDSSRILNSASGENRASHLVPDLSLVCPW